MKTVLILFVLFALVVATLVVLADRTWKSRTAQIVARLDAMAAAPDTGGFAPAMLDSLPAPVARYLRAVLRDGAPIARHVVVSHEGRFRADLVQPTEWPFRSVEHFDAHPAGYVWDARMRVAPMLDVFVRDLLLDGQSSVNGRMCGLFPVVQSEDDAQIDAAALQRWLAETLWFPTALLPGQSVTWSALDDSTARASAVAGATHASVDFHFGADSLVAFVRTEARGRLVAQSIVPTPWRCTVSNWQWRSGTRMPVQGEAAWELVSGTIVYWRGTVTDVAYE